MWEDICLLTPLPGVFHKQADQNQHYSLDHHGHHLRKVTAHIRHLLDVGRLLKIWTLWCCNQTEKAEDGGESSVFFPSYPVSSPHEVGCKRESEEPVPAVLIGWEGGCGGLPLSNAVERSHRMATSMRTSAIAVWSSSVLGKGGHDTCCSVLKQEAQRPMLSHEHSC